ETNGGEAQEPESEEPVAEEPEQAEEPSGPVIHVPDRELGSDEGDEPAPVKKKTRRGTRGGKNRKKKTARATGTGAALAVAEDEAHAPDTGAVEEPQLERQEDEEQQPEPLSQNGEPDWSYTPMSQWGLDEPE